MLGGKKKKKKGRLVERRRSSDQRGRDLKNRRVGLWRGKRRRSRGPTKINKGGVEEK